MYGLVGEAASGSTLLESSIQMDRTTTSSSNDSITSNSQSSERVTTPTDNRGGIIRRTADVLYDIGRVTKDSLVGVVHGGIDFVIGAEHLTHRILAQSNGASAEMIRELEQSQRMQIATVSDNIIDYMGVDRSYSNYQAFRNGTRNGLMFCGIFAAIYYSGGSAVFATSGLSVEYGLASRTALSTMTSNKVTSSSVTITNIAKSSFKMGELQGELLKEHARQLKVYGAHSVRQLQNNRIRYYGVVKAADKPGAMIGTRKVREWDPRTGLKKTWFETLDGKNNIRQVRPEKNSGAKSHFRFDIEGNYIGKW